MKTKNSNTKLYITLTLSVIASIVIALSSLLVFLPRNEQTASADSVERVVPGSNEPLIDYNYSIIAPMNSSHTYTAPVNWLDRPPTTFEYSDETFFKSISIFVLHGMGVADNNYVEFFQPVTAMVDIVSPNYIVTFYNSSNIPLYFYFNENTRSCYWLYSSGEFLVYSLTIAVNPYIFTGGSAVDFNPPIRTFLQNVLTSAQRYVFSAIPTFAFDLGFENGQGGSFEQIYNQGYDYGYALGYSNGSSTAPAYQKGFEAGVKVGQSQSGDGNASLLGLMSAVVDAPIQAFSGLMNFKIFDIDLAPFLLSLFTVCIIISVVRIFI